MRKPYTRRRHYALTVLTHIGCMADDSDTLAPLQVLDGACSGVVPDEWAALPPEVSALVQEYCGLRTVCGQSMAMPPGVRQALEQPQRLAAELTYLDGRIAAQPDAHVVACRDNLRLRLADDAALHASVTVEVAERLRDAVGAARIAALEHQITACYQDYVAKAVDTRMPELHLSADLINALLMAARIVRNHTLLIRLIRAHLAGQQDWRETLPGNVAFLAELATTSVNVEAWLGTYARAFTDPALAGERVILHLETDPLRILQMGNYFGTCLSLTEYNAYSAVTNACELNKRVIYATNKAGVVIGRKLIAITDSMQLVGFRTYSILNGDARAVLDRIFSEYVRDFAAGCSLALADEGAVKTLFAEGWYDDGAQEWQCETANISA